VPMVVRMAVPMVVRTAVPMVAPADASS